MRNSTQKVFLVLAKLGEGQVFITVHVPIRQEWNIPNVREKTAFDSYYWKRCINCEISPHLLFQWQLQNVSFILISCLGENSHYDK